MHKIALNFLSVLGVLLSAGISQAQPANILGTEPLAKFGFNTPVPDNKREVVTVTQPTFNEAIRVTVARKPDQVHQVQIGRRN